MQIKFEKRKSDGKHVVIFPKKAVQGGKRKIKGRGVKNILNGEACELVDRLPVDGYFVNPLGQVVVELK